MTPKLEAAARQALDALEYVLKPTADFDEAVRQKLHDTAITALREALAEQERLQQETCDLQVAEQEIDETTKVTDHVWGAPPFRFRRFVYGQERAQDVLIEREETLERAIKTAARICPPSEMTVLVYEGAHPPARKPLTLTGHQIMHLASMVRDADSLDIIWSIKELPPLSALEPEGPCAGGIAATTEGQPGWALLSAAPTQQAAEPLDDALDRTLKERDDAEDFIDALLDEVLGNNRPEWSSAYGRSDALNDVRERLAEQQAAEPGHFVVVDRRTTPSGRHSHTVECDRPLPIGCILHTHPAHTQQPLTDGQKLMCWSRATHDADVEHKTEHQCLMDYGTEIEAAHNITGSKT